MNCLEVLQRLDQERRQLCYDGAIAEFLPRVTRERAADGSHHSIIFSSLSIGDADDIIDEQIEHYRKLGLSFEWKLFAHDTPPDLMQRLQRKGFSIGRCEAVLVYDLKNEDEWINDASVGKVIRIEHPEQISDFRHVAENVFGKDFSFTSNELLEALRRGSTQHRGYIAYDNDEPVSVGRLYTHPQSIFAGLYGGGTLTSHRRKGFYRALVAARARDAITAGARYLQVDALPTSCPILQKLGFVKITETWPCEWKP